jgi:ATP-dependent DNA helicase RecQ
MSGAIEMARVVLREFFGYEDFRPGQIDVVAAVLGGNDTLAVLPTGGGKSLCYQVPALVRPGLTVVISPLISLMKDQVDRLVARGVPATFLNSSITRGEISDRLARATRGDLTLLYVAPERFESADLQRCLARSRVTLIAVDEAHCISEWGHDFRPSFRRIAAVTRKLGGPQMIALTATATPAVRADIVRQLGMRSPRVIVSGFDRANLYYEVRPCRDDAAKGQQLVDVMRAHPRPAIVYAATRASVERTARQLNRTGVRALPYHAGLDDQLRGDVQERFMAGEVDTIVATNAFGMGIDKPDVRLVVHQAMPGTLEAYYQEAGRAGRDGNPAQCVLLHARDDRLTHEWFIRCMYPARAMVERTYESVRATHVDGRIGKQRAGRDADAAMRLLQQEGVLVERGRNSTRMHVRVLATSTRIQRELAGTDRSVERSLLRMLGDVGGAAIHDGFTVDLRDLPSEFHGRTARDLLERLRGAQFVDFNPVDAGLYLTQPESTLDGFAIDWDSMERRRLADLAKLDKMQEYATTRICRRAFVLRYFGERRAKTSCGGCDNCRRAD